MTDKQNTDLLPFNEEALAEALYKTDEDASNYCWMKYADSIYRPRAKRMFQYLNNTRNTDLLPERRLIRCCGCDEKVEARLTDGCEIYPHRPDLAELPFWKCDGCGNHVGCHHKTSDRTRPLGNIPTPELRNARKHIHAILDPLWKSRKYSRNELYQKISDHMGFGYHTAQLRTIDEARKVYKFVKGLAA